MTYTLICEGPCNPELPDLDRRVRQAVRMDGSRPLLTDADYATLKALRHTPHEMRGGDAAVCVDCGTVRRYGR